MSTGRIGVVVAVLAMSVASVPARTDAQSSLEYQLLSLVNGGRGHSLVMHSGLLAAARGHSRDMSAGGGLSHAGAAGRIENASPDPAEGNGAPDDGYTGTWCENIAYVSGAPDSEVPSRIYDGWLHSPPHLRCMRDAAMTVAGIGLYLDGKTWWATMESMQDRTLPGSHAVVAASTSAPAERPVATVTTPPATPVPVVTDPIPEEIAAASPPATVGTYHPRIRAEPIAVGPTGDTPARSKPFGWPEAAAGLGIVAASTFAFVRMSRGLAGKGRR